MRRLQRVIVASTLIAAGGMGGYLMMRAGEADRGGPIAASQTGGNDAAGPAAAPPVPAVDPQEVLRILLHDLRDPAARTAAEARLAVLPETYHNWLRILGDQMLDPELKALLAARLAAMEEQLAVAPLPVSLHVQDATLVEIIPLLNADVHGRMFANPLSTRSRFSLDAKDRPFWEVIAALNQQHPLGLTPYSGQGKGDLQFLDAARPDELPVLQKMQVQGPFMCYIRWKGPPMWATATAPVDPVLETMFAVDPRLAVVEAQVWYEPVTDEQGRVLFVQPPPFNPVTEARQVFSAEIRYGRALPLTAAVGCRRVNVKIKARIVLALASMDADIDALETKGKFVVELGSSTVTLSSTRDAQQLFVQQSVTSTSVPPHLLFDLFDRDNAVLRRWSYQGAAGIGAELGAGAPYRLHVANVQKTREFQVEFEFKDWPLPGNPG